MYSLRSKLQFFQPLFQIGQFYDAMKCGEKWSERKHPFCVLVSSICLRYSERDSWDLMLQQGIQLLERFCQEDRVRIRQPRRNLQIKFERPLSQGNDFVAYVDAIGKLDGRGCLLEWKTTSSRYPEQPEGLLALDPQLLCYSWITGILKWRK